MPFWKPTVIAKPSFNAEESARNLNKAFKGIGTDEKLVIKELVEHTNQQRQQIKEKYLEFYGKTLEHDLKSELKGNFEDVAVALLKPRFEYDAENLRKAIHGLGTNVKVVIEILCTKDGNEINKLKETYQSLYNSDLEADMANEESGDLGKLFNSLVSGSRPKSGDVDHRLADQEAQQLFDAGIASFGTNESELTRILATRSFAQLRATFDAYSSLTGKDIEDSIKSETYGNFEKALVTIIRSVRNRPGFFARLLESEMKGIGTKEDAIIRIIVSRSEIDLVDIRREYKALYSKPLYQILQSELTGDFEDIMVKLVGKD